MSPQFPNLQLWVREEKGKADVTKKAKDTENDWKIHFLVT